MIRAFLIMTSWLVLMISSFNNPEMLLVSWAILPFASLLAYAILENKYASFRK